jgi:hypothetical protein
MLVDQAVAVVVTAELVLLELLTKVLLVEMALKVIPMDTQAAAAVVLQKLALTVLKVEILREWVEMVLLLQLLGHPLLVLEAAAAQVIM